MYGVRDAHRQDQRYEDDRYHRHVPSDGSHKPVCEHHRHTTDTQRQQGHNRALEQPEGDDDDDGNHRWNENPQVRIVARLAGLAQNRGTADRDVDVCAHRRSTHNFAKRGNEFVLFSERVAFSCIVHDDRGRLVVRG